MSVRDTVIRVAPAGLLQTVAVSVSLRPTLRFLACSLAPDRPRAFGSRRLGHRVVLRPRADRQVARELLSKNVYELPREVRSALGQRGADVKVLDLGGNIGLFTLNVLQELGPGTTVDVVEPDPENLAILRRNVELGGYTDRVVVHPAAGGAQAGSAVLIRHAPHNTHLAHGDETDEHTATVEVLDALALAGDRDFLKLDIEGGEWPLLDDPRFIALPLAAIVLEWHDVRGSPADPARHITELLRGAGYTVGHCEQFSDDTGTIWAWRMGNPSGSRGGGASAPPNTPA